MIDFNAFYRELLKETAEIERWPAWLRTMRERRLRAVAYIREHAADDEAERVGESDE